MTFEMMSWRSKRIVSAAGISAAFLLAACATTPAAMEDDTRLTFSADGLATLDAAMEKAVTEGEVYGLSYVLAQGGETVAANHFGVQNLMSQTPLDEDTIFRIYSMTKPVTGVAMMQLYEQGLWDLDDPVTKHVPEFANLRVLKSQKDDGTPVMVAANRAPTMREVMNHTAGFAYGLAGTDYANEAFRSREIMGSPDLETFIQKTADVPLLFQPGERWAYSAAVDVQGYIVQKLSGQKFSEYLDEHIFTPLSMDDTGFYVPADDYSRFSDVFGLDPKSGKLFPIPTPGVAFKKETIAMESGGGGLVATIGDYANFCQMLVDEGSFNGHQILKPETVQLMATNTLAEGMDILSTGDLGAQGRGGHGFGLDFAVIYDAEKAGTPQPDGTYYWGGAAGTWFWIDPVNDLYFIGMIQRFGMGASEGYQPSRVSVTDVYGALEK